MAHVVSDRVRETTSSNGTSNFSLAGAATGGFVTFASKCSNGDTFYYCAQNTSQGEFEVGFGTYATSGNSITRPSSVLTNSAGTTAKISFTNNPQVFITNAGQTLGMSWQTGVSAAGTDQSGATSLTRNFNQVSTTAANAGVKLAGTIPQWVRNDGANALKVYPHSGGTINGGSANAAVTLAVGGTVLFLPTSTTALISF